MTKKSAKLTGVGENAALAVSGQFTVQEDYTEVEVKSYPCVVLI